LSLREQIIAEMQRHEKENSDKFPTWGRQMCAPYCTWWFKFKLPFTTAEIRRELDRMERDKLVTANREQSNNTKWMLALE
jgi:hypothetical protein